MAKFIYILLRILSIIGIPAPICRQKRHLEGVSFAWWERVDSNHRSETQQIYSLPPLATRELSHMKLKLVDGLEPPTC